MRIDKDLPVPMSDGNVLRANVYRPDGAGRYPVVFAHGVYGKDVHFADGFKPQWDRLLVLYPDLCRDGSTGRYLRWEIVDPERWVPDGYIVIQVDARGSGKSPGYLDPYSPREIRDYYESIEWAAAQPWSNGKVGLIGISYFAITQWLVAALQPPSLAAMIAWEGASDHYRDWSYHGGILSNAFLEGWWPRQCLENQHGNAASKQRDRDSGERTTGPALDADLLEGNRADYMAQLKRHRLADAFHRERSPDFSRIMVPLLSAGNWGGPGVHLRGNIEGFQRAASKEKWLSMHDGTHFESFYLPQYVALQKRFFDRFLKGDAHAWRDEPPVRISVRRPDGSTRRDEQAFPLERTEWTRLYLDAAAQRLAEQPPAATARSDYDARGDGVSFSTDPFERDTEFTGFVTLRLAVSSSTRDLDLFVTLHALGPDGRDLTLSGAHEPTPIARGWLRASHRKLDPARSTPYRVYHAHDEIRKLTPGAVVTLDIEIWPTCFVFPAGYRLVATIKGCDWEVPGVPGRILHNDPDDRDQAEFGGVNTIHTGGANESYLLMPWIPG